MRLSFRIRCGVMMALAGLQAIFAAEQPGGTPLKAGREPLLAAFNAYLQHQGRWAYTETHSGIGYRGRPNGESVFRFDPSQPYTEQYQPIKIGGNLPSEKQLKQWAQRGEEQAERREKNIGLHNDDVYLRIYNEDVTPLIDEAVVIAETETSVTYDVPMKKKGSPNAALFDKFQLTTRVNKERPNFEHVTIRQRLPMHAGAGKFLDGLIEIEFGSPDAQFPAVPVKITSSSTNKPRFGKANTLQNVAVRTDLRHVTPYDERFEVRLGPIRTIEF